jgi:hypothetical protein
MKVPAWLKGALFAPTLLVLLFGLKLTCPAGGDCFSDVFATTAFMPLAAVYRVFGPAQIILAHEPIFLLTYWMVVGLLIGLLYDLARKKTKE